MLLLSFTIQPVVVLAQATTPASLDDGFRPERILDDEDIFELGNMNRAQIQAFLLAKGTLGTTRLSDIDGIEKPVADIVWRIATSYKINPKYLLVLLQKEQSLVEDLFPTSRQFDWATGYGVCDNCSKSDPSIQDFKGFASQLEWAAKQHREKYLQQILTRGKTIAGHAPGQESLIDGRRITPQNQATAMLYSYTPHIAGNFNLWRIWRRWFGLTFPDGTIVAGKESGQVYLIRFGQKRPLKSRAVAASIIDTDKILSVEDSQLSSYPEGKPLAFANYSIVETEGKRYLIDGQKKRFILNSKVFQRLGFNEDEVIPTSPADLETYEEGPDITLATAYPTGLLAKDVRGTYWYVDGNARHLIPHKTLLNLYFRSTPAKTLSAKELSAFPVGEPYGLRDGELVRTPTKPDVYVIEHGLRRPIPTGEIFEEMGWNWKNVMTLPENLLTQYAIGELVDPYAHEAIISPTLASAETSL